MSKKVVIIGAGPCGLLLAHYLLRREQYQVEIYERRSQSSISDFMGNRTFSLALQDRGKKSLEKIPNLAKIVADNSVFCFGRMIYSQKGKPREIPRKKPAMMISRNRLVSILLEELIKNASSDNLKIKFDCECENIDINSKTMTFKSSQGERLTVNYDILVGADGTRSYVREFLKETTGLNSQENEVPDAYKTLFLNLSNPEYNLSLETNKIHRSALGDNCVISMVPQPEDQQLNGVIIFNAQNNPFETLKTQEDVIHFFQEKFPLFAKLLPEFEAEELLKRPLSRILTIRCDRFHEGDSILLIGDAAHGVSPSIGQGCNAALEDVFILDQLLDQYQDDWGIVLSSFSQQRVPDAHALQELANYTFPRNNKRLATEFLMRSLSGKVLNKYFPHWFPPSILTLISDSDIPYSQILNAHQGWINKVKNAQKVT